MEFLVHSPGSSAIARSLSRWKMLSAPLPTRWDHEGLSTFLDYTCRDWWSWDKNNTVGSRLRRVHVDTFYQLQFSILMLHLTDIIINMMRCGLVHVQPSSMVYFTSPVIFVTVDLNGPHGHSTWNTIAGCCSHAFALVVSHGVISISGSCSSHTWHSLMPNSI